MAIISNHRAIRRNYPREPLVRLDEVLRGRVNWIGEVTLAVSPATSTTVQDLRVTPDSSVLLQPVDANAASIINKVHVAPDDYEPGSDYGSTKVGEFTVSHPCVSGTMKYRYGIMG